MTDGHVDQMKRVTYKDLKSYKVGEKGEKQNYHLGEWQTVFTIDRDVVTGIERVKLSDTLGGQETRQVTQEERQQRIKQDEMKQNALQQAVLKIMFSENK